MLLRVLLLLVLASLCGAYRRCMGDDVLIGQQDKGYRGIWYSNQRTDTEYVYKYSGGLGTYCAKHVPTAVYAPEVKKTFFVYGGTSPTRRNLLEMVSFYDHETDTVPRPTILLDKKTSDAHDNPVLSIDDNGYIWAFASSHGTARPSYILKSKRPYQIDAFELVHETNFSYPQPWHIPGKGFLFLHTRYEGGRCLCWQRSADGVTWSERSRLASVDEGHYQVSWPCNGKVGTAFNYHPKAFAGDAKRHGLNWRTNLYYVETPDMGASWRTVSGAPVALPLTTPHNPALVIDYESQGLLAYMKDLNYDPNGNPIILHVTARSWEPGPAHGPRAWRIARWTGAEWRLHAITTSDSNYDMGSLYVEAKGVWRVIAPTETGPQPYNPGGEIAVWVSDDRGQSWSKIRQLTRESPFNHTYVRRPLNAQPGFYALWADGHARRPSESRLYFADKQGARVRRLPYEMDEAYAVPDTID